MSKWSKSWNSSIKPRKQRNYRNNAPLHIKRKMVSSHLSKELRQKHHIRNVEIRKGDKAKIVRGQFKGRIGKVDRVNTKSMKIFISGIDLVKKEGSKVFPPIDPSNLIITELNLEDKRRLGQQKKGKETKEEGKKSKEANAEAPRKAEAKKEDKAGVQAEEIKLKEGGERK